MSRRAKPCPVDNCPELRPCPDHEEARPGIGFIEDGTLCPWDSCPEFWPCPVHKNLSRSPDRDRKAHDGLRWKLIKHRGPVCERCDKPGENPKGKGLAMHHKVKGSNRLEDVELLCFDCHQKVDKYATDPTIRRS